MFFYLSRLRRQVRGDLAGAIGAAGRAVERRHPSAPNLWHPLNLAELLVEARRWGEALEVMDEAQLEASSSTALRQRALQARVTALEGSGRREEAEAAQRRLDLLISPRIARFLQKAPGGDD